MSFSDRGKKFESKKEKKTKSYNVSKMIDNLQAYKKAEENLPDFHVVDVELSLLTDDEKEKIAEVVITQIGEDTRDQSGNLSNNELGATVTSRCDTCKFPISQCKAGHVGIIRFPRGVKIYLPIVFEDILVKLLNCVCYLDGTYYLSFPAIMEKLANKNDAPVSQKLTELKKQSEGGHCRNDPNHLRRHYTVMKSGKFKKLKYYYGKDDKKRTADINEIAKILYVLEAEADEKTGHEGNEITEYLGIRKLRAYITSRILVPPTYLRQSFECKGGLNSHDITKIYEKIVKIIMDYNNKVRNKNPIKPSDLSKNIYLLVEKLHKDTGNNYSNIKKNNIDKELKGKKGAVRRFMFAKVNEVVARLVIDGDSRLRLDQVMIPQNLRYILTIPVLITSDNADEIIRLGEEGKISKIKYNHGESKGNILPVLKGTIKVSEGDEVFRHLQNEDIIIINRQPSLWIGNMLAFRVVLNPDPKSNVMYFNQALCSSYNADFDGDEMNLSVPQTAKGQMDAKEKLFVIENLISRHKSSPGFTLILNNVIAFFFLSKEKINKHIFDLCFIQIYTRDYNEFCNRVALNGMIDIRKISSNMYYDKIIPGNILVSALFPPDFYYEEPGIEIRNGLIFGSENISKSIRNIIHRISDQYGDEVAVDFINCATFATEEYMSRYGFTVSLQDYYLDSDKDSIRESINKLIDKVNMEVIELSKIKRETKNNLEKRNIEEQIKGKLNTLSFLIFKIIDDDKKNEKNAFFDMVYSKAKGSSINIIQLLATVGQPYFNNERPNYVVPYFNNKSKFFGIKSDYNYNIENQGFVRESYYSGIPMNIIAHSALAAREGQIANVEIVPNAGNLFRSLTNAHINIRSNKKGQVKMGKTKLQELFGGDGLDPKKTFNIDYNGEKIHFFIDINSTINKINNEYGVFKIDKEAIRKESNPPLIIETRGAITLIRDDIPLSGGTFQRGFIEYLLDIEGPVSLVSEDEREIESFKISCNRIGKEYGEGFKEVDMSEVEKIITKKLIETTKENNIDLITKKIDVYVNNERIARSLTQVFFNSKVYVGEGEGINWIY